MHPTYGNSDDTAPDCSLETISYNKDRRESYEALSYVWGRQPKTREIYVRNGAKGTLVLKVTSTLLIALKHLRYKDRERRFWVDAVCINQDNKPELNQQVPLMSRIYNGAQNVCVWLGESDDRSNLAMKLLPKIRDLKKFEENINKKTTCDEWHALIELMGRDWFRRRWVVQEIALARRASIHCGSATLSWSDFSEAIALFKAAVPLINSKFREDKNYKHEPDYVGNVGEYPASRLVAATSVVVRKSEDSDVLMKVKSLEYLVSTMTPFQATECADSVYAVLSLANDVPGYSKVIAPTATIETPGVGSAAGETDQGKKPSEYEKKLLSKTAKLWQEKAAEKYVVDYRKPFTAIAIDFLKFVFDTSKSLDMICRPWAPLDAVSSLPSWMLTLEGETHVQRRDNKTMVRRRADVLVGHPGESHYSASGRYPPTHNIMFDKDIPNSKAVLAVAGFPLDKIARRDDAASMAVVPETWFELGGWDVRQSATPPESFWRTMVADRDGEGRSPPAWYPLACKHALSYWHDESDAIDLSRVGERLDDPMLLKQFINRLKSVVWGRRLARSRDENFLALIPAKAKEEDEIFIVAGISVPVILRPREDGTYEFVGECYVHGMMDGEAFEVKRRLDLKWKEYQLR